MRKVIINANKNGFLYVIDRTNGKLIAAHPLTRVTWATHVDLKTGRPVLTDVAARLTAGEEVEFYPQRGTNATLFAFNPRTELVYLNSWDLPRIQKFVPYKFERLGEPSTAVAGRNAVIKPGDVVGYHVAMNPLTGQMKWKIPITDIPNAASVLATGGGAALHRPADGRVHRARRRHRSDALAVQDRFEHQCAADHLHAQGTAIRDGAVGPRRQRDQALRRPTRFRPAARSGPSP